MRSYFFRYKGNTLVETIIRGMIQLVNRVKQIYLIIQILLHLLNHLYIHTYLIICC